ncbi:hypothetical protein ACJZ2D_003796 [Fusarium nematophilum]
MASSSRMPHLLESYLALPPESSLILLTSVLGASANWLVLRHVYSYLKGSSADGDDGSKDTGVVLGLDLDALGRTGRFTFIDGLTGLYGNGPSTARPAAPAARKERVLQGTSLQDVKKEIEGAVADLRTSRKVLIVDQLDALLAITEESTTSLALQNLVLFLRSVSPFSSTFVGHQRNPLAHHTSQLVHSTLLTLSADTPLVAAQATTLEREHASLALSTAHAADAVLALRMLDTGTARDVSGVVRITGPGVGGMGGPAEFLYHVAADGGVRVFERGT